MANCRDILSAGCLIALAENEIIKIELCLTGDLLLLQRNIHCAGMCR